MIRVKGPFEIPYGIFSLSFTTDLDCAILIENQIKVQSKAKQLLDTYVINEFTEC